MAAAGAAPLATTSIFSSTSALLGPAGQANYAAANAALGAWADQQHAAGVAATSVMWGAWAAGMAAVDKVPLLMFRHLQTLLQLPLLLCLVLLQLHPIVCGAVTQQDEQQHWLHACLCCSDPKSWVFIRAQR